VDNLALEKGFLVISSVLLRSQKIETVGRKTAIFSATGGNGIARKDSPSHGILVIVTGMRLTQPPFPHTSYGSELPFFLATCAYNTTDSSPYTIQPCRWKQHILPGVR
jgi:hypothetical protein